MSRDKLDGDTQFSTKIVLFVIFYAKKITSALLSVWVADV